MTRSAPVRGVAGALAALSFLFCPPAGGQPRPPSPPQSVTGWGQPEPPPPGQAWPANPFAPPGWKPSQPSATPAPRPPEVKPRNAWTTWQESLAGSGTSAPPGPLPKPDVEFLFRDGSSAFDSGGFLMAAERFEALLKDFPDSAHVPEATYKLAACRLLQNDKDAAARTFERLLDHPDSPWTKLALRGHITGDRVAELADELRRKGRTKGSPEARRAMRLYDLHIKHFPLGPNPDRKKLWELAYKVADCARLDCQEDLFRRGMAGVAAADPKGAWGKLAGIRLAGPPEFLSSLTDLVELSDAGNDRYLAVLELSEQYLPALRGDDRAKCLYYRAVACEGLERAGEAEPLYREVTARHPGSTWAPEAAFWLAESRLRAKDYAGARAGYADLVARFPSSPRARQALRWLGNWESADADWAALQVALEKLAEQVVARKGGLHLRARLGTAGGSECLLHVAMGGPDHFLADLATANQRFLLASNEGGAWYYRPKGRVVLHARSRMAMPVPDVGWNPDPAANSMTVDARIGSNGDGGKFSIVLPRSSVSRLIEDSRRRSHLTRLVRRDGPAGERVTFRLESPVRACSDLNWLELQFAPDGTLAELRCEIPGKDRKRWGLTLTELAFGGPFPPDAFALRLPEGVPVEEVGRIEPGEILVDLFADLMHEAARLSESATLPKTK